MWRYRLFLSIFIGYKHDLFIEDNIVMYFIPIIYYTNKRNLLIGIKIIS